MKPPKRGAFDYLVDDVTAARWSRARSELRETIDKHKLKRLAQRRRRREALNVAIGLAVLIVAALALGL